MTGAASLKSVWPMPRLVVADGTVEGLKWLGLLLMTGDHVNKYLFNGTLPFLFEAGRLAMPIFVFVLAFNLARPGQLERGVYQRTMKRLAAFGALASIPFIALGGLYAGWWPLNILFTLLALTATAYLIERGNIAWAALVLMGAGAMVEYWWPALLFGLAVWSYARKPTLAAAGVAVIACAALGFINGNMWALAVLPVLLSATCLNLRMPRLRWAFYAYYPLHLGALWLIRIPMSHAGYLFF
ncbi:conjugal transfer protein TraX [Salmonella enterica]|jgi:TraX protein.|nr:conjugal transfer protein TraX [Salmonella enterica]